MHKMVNGLRVEMSVAEIKEVEEMRKQAKLEKEKREAKEKQDQLDKIKKMQSAGLSDTAIIEVLPYAQEHLNDPEYLKEKEQKRLQKQELEAQEQAQKEAQKTEELQGKIHILKKKGFDEETIKIILPETKPLFKVNASPKKRVGKVK